LRERIKAGYETHTFWEAIRFKKMDMSEKTNPNHIFSWDLFIRLLLFS